MRRYELIRAGGMADLATAAEFAAVTVSHVKMWARRQWAVPDQPDRALAVACDVLTGRLLYDAAAVQRLATTRPKRILARSSKVA